MNKYSSEWIFKFETKDAIYYKSQLTSYLDETYGDISGKITDIEHEILLEIEAEVIFGCDIVCLGLQKLS
jgi:hypothetical protein